jgi:hypothetical protein
MHTLYDTCVGGSKLECEVYRAFLIRLCVNHSYDSVQYSITYSSERVHYGLWQIEHSQRILQLFPLSFSVYHRRSTQIHINNSEMQF